MSLAVLLAQYNKVTVLDVDETRVNKINNGLSTVIDTEIELFLAEQSLSLFATTDKKIAYEGASFIIVATPTDYNAEINYFDTSSVDSVVGDALDINQSALVVIKSTLPIGHVKSLQKKFKTERVIFSPEFLREGQALKDNLYPSRIIIGSRCKAGKEFAFLLKQAAKKIDTELLFINSTEAEAVKLFANTFLAMRVSFFNELDSFSMAYNLESKSIINGICLDERIGDGYNNPSFGYGGYCLPKDTKQLLSHYEQVPQTLMEAIVSSNATRKDFIANEILKSNPKVVGFYRLAMKEGSDNFRSAAIQGIIRRIIEKNITTVVYEPSLDVEEFYGSKVIHELDEFKDKCQIILANRMTKNLEDVRDKLFTRDIFGNN